jgi:hypothetical protein
MQLDRSADGCSRNREHLVRCHQNALARLGLQVVVTQLGDGTPPTPPPDNGARQPDPRPTPPARQLVGCAGGAARQAKVPKIRHEVVHGCGEPRVCCSALFCHRLVTARSLQLPLRSGTWKPRHWQSMLRHRR